MKQTIRVVLSCAALLASVRAWVPEHTEVWPDGDIPISFDFSAAPAGSLDWTSAATEAVATWNPLLQRAQLKIVPLLDHAWYDNGHNELFFDSAVYGQPFPKGVLAITLISIDRGSPTEADVVFNKDINWSVYHGSLLASSDFRRVAVHELGHVLGLDHPDEAGQSVSAIMNSTEGDIELPAADDAAGIHALYDRGSTAPPVILGAPAVSAATVVEGNWVRFGIAAGGRGPLSYQWSRDGGAVAGATSAILRLAAARVADAGNYTVAVSNASGSAKSSSIALAVTPATAPSVAPEYVNTSVTVTCGDDCSILTHGVSVGSAPTQYVWKHNGVTVGSSTDAYLTIYDAQFSDAGDYSVTVSNVAGSADGMTYHITVVPGQPPEFQQDTSDTRIALGGSGNLSAYATGSGILHFQWYKDGIAIPGATSSAFAISKASPSDGGTYTVTAMNVFGIVTSAAQTVSIATSPDLVPPAIIDQPKPVTDFAGAPGGFSITTEGDNLTYKWYKDGTLIGSSTQTPSLQSTYWINRMHESDSGLYTVEISNSLGSTISRPAKLTVLPAAAPLIKGQFGGYTGPIGQAFQLNVQVQQLSAVSSSSPGDFTYEWFKNGMSLGHGDSTLNLTGVAADSGNYFVRITSAAGASTDSKTETVTVQAGTPPLIEYVPSDLLLDSSNSEELRLTAVALEVDQRRQLANGITTTYAQQTVDGPTLSGISPGTYVKTATDGTRTESSAPYKFGFLPAIIPVLGVQPGSREASLGDAFALTVFAGAHAPVTYQWSKDGADIPGGTAYNYYFPHFTADQAASYRVAVTSAAGTTVSDPAVVELRTATRPIITTQPLSAVTAVNRYVELEVAAAGGGLTYQWYKDGAALLGATNARFDIYSAGADSSGEYSVVVSNTGGSVTSRTANVRVILPQRPPEITLQPQSTTGSVGGDVTLTTGATGGPLPDHYQWKKDGVDIPGANDAELRLHNVQPADAANYSVVAFNSNGSATSTAAALTVDTSGRLINLSTRARVGTGDNVLIAGFVVTGSKPRTLLIRGVGDQLSDFGVSGVLRNPFLELYGPNSTRIDSSDNWAEGDDFDGARTARIAQIQAAAQQVGAFPLRTDSQDSALIATLTPGLYSAKLSGMVNTTGVALVEIYEVGTPGIDRLINLSCRSNVGVGDKALFVGVGIRGQSKRRVLIRATGPGLAAFNVSGALADPQMAVYHGNDVIATNNDWGDRGAAASIRAAEDKVGAFPLNAGSKDAAIVLDLDPALYSVKVTGVGDTTGVALVEVYEVPN